MSRQKIVFVPRPAELSDNEMLSAWVGISDAQLESMCNDLKQDETTLARRRRVLDLRRNGV